jgi:hypothetical protein
LSPKRKLISFATIKPLSAIQNNIFVSSRFKKKHKFCRFHRKKLGTKIAYLRYGYRKNKTMGANRYKQTKRRL